MWVWCAFAFFALSFQLDNIPPYHTDEYYYLQSVKNMFDSQDFLTPYYYENKRFNKPILIYWLMALSGKVFGIGLGAFRLPSAVFGALSVWLTYLLGRRLFDRRSGIMAMVILPGLWLHFLLSRVIRPDMVMTFFILTAFLFFLRAFQGEGSKRLNLILFYGSIGLGFMAKGPAAIVIPGIAVCLFLWCTRKWNSIGSMRLMSGTLIFLVICLPWFLAMVLLHGQEFIDHIWKVELEGRVLRKQEFSLFYFYIFILHHLPWSLFWLTGFASLTGLASLDSPGKKKRKISSIWRGFRIRMGELFKQKENQALSFCLLWLFTPLVFFTLMRTDLNWYIISTSPVLALMVGHFFTRLLGTETGFHNKLFKWPFWATIIFFLVAALTGIFLCWVYDPIIPNPTLTFLFPFFLLAATAILIALFRKKRFFHLILVLGFVQTINLAIYSGESLAYFNFYPMRAISQSIEKTAGDQEWVYLVNFSNDKGKLGIQSKRWIGRKQSPETYRKIIEGKNRVFFVMRESTWKKEFGGYSLKLISEAKRLKSIKGNAALVRLIREKGLSEALKSKLEKVVLLSNR